MSEKIDATIAYVRKELALAESGHDWFHIQRVYNNALQILKIESEVDAEVVKLIALLHDIADSKFHNGDETVGPAKARKWLKSIGYDTATIEHVVKGIENIDKIINIDQSPIAQDADRLDGIGAVGIARTFNYGGFANNTIYDPDIAPRFNMTKEEYKSHKGTTINHFYEKLLLLKDLMNTEAGKKIAEGRHKFMESFLAQFYAECEGQK